MKFLKKYFIVLVWAAVIIILRFKGIITFDLDSIGLFLETNAEYAAAIFSGLWIVRLGAFIPGTILMVLGGVFFGPLKGFLLSMAGVVASELLIFIIGRKFSSGKLRERIDRKHPEIGKLIEKYSWGFLLLGIICPITPSDAICYLAAASGIHYIKYILTVTLANIPIILMYSFVGLSFTSSVYSMIFVIASIILVAVLTVTIWNNLKKKTFVKTESYKQE